MLAAMASYHVFYETYGSDAQIITVLFGPLVLFPTLACLCVRRLRMPTVVTIIVLCMAFVLSQAQNASRLSKLRAEVRQIAAYLDANKKAHGAYPADLSNYGFLNPRF